MLNTSISKLGTLPKKVAAAKIVQSLNAPTPTDITEAGMVTDVNLVQAKNANCPIVVTEDGIVIDVKPVQVWNAFMPIVVIVEFEANVIDVKLIQS